MQGSCRSAARAFLKRAKPPTSSRKGIIEIVLGTHGLRGCIIVTTKTPVLATKKLDRSAVGTYCNTVWSRRVIWVESCRDVGMAWQDCAPE